MRKALSVSALAKNAGVTTKTLRYWEGIGLLPRANRTHTGYRVFAPEVMRYIDFILKAKTVGLTLSEMKRAIELAEHGENPCPEVMRWLDAKDKVLEQQIRSLGALRQRLRRFRVLCSANDALTCAREKELCCLIEDLLNSRLRKGDDDETVPEAPPSMIVVAAPEAITFICWITCAYSVSTAGRQSESRDHSAPSPAS